MRPQTWLIFGCFGLGTIITYCWWAAIRTSLFRLRLAEIRDELDSVVSQKGQTGHASYVDARRDINRLIEFAPYFSIPIFLVFKRLGSSSERSDGRVRQVRRITEIPGLADEIDEVESAIVQVCVAVMSHIVVTPSFLAYFLWRAASGRSEQVFAELTGLIAEMARMSHDLRAVEGLPAMSRVVHGSRVAAAGR